jgi:hypothetical protein
MSFFPLSEPIRYDQFMSPAHAKAAEEKASDAIYNGIRQEGYHYRMVGAPISRCPRYKLPDWISVWRSGWYAADEEIRKVKR